MRSISLREIGEAGLIKKISDRVKVDSTVIKGIGDDAAVIKWKKDYLLLFASDMIIEGVHFDLKKATPFQVGKKALGVNISDIAAMGGVPRYACVSLGLPRNLDLKFIGGLYSGIMAMARRFGVNISGGDTNYSERIVVDISIIGYVKKRELALRSGARPGDVIAVTGRLGGSIKGRHTDFTPRLKESRILVRRAAVRSMIDVSDGLSTDLLRLCKASSFGAVIYESLIPLSKEARGIKGALSDGEDFELLFTVPKGTFMRVKRDFSKKSKTPLTAIGEVTKGRGVFMVTRAGKRVPLADAGFSHF